MTQRRVELDDEVAAEIEEAAGWHAERDATLPGRLLAEVDAAVIALAQRPKRFPRVLGLPTGADVRRARLRRFRYTLVFVETDEAIRIIAMAHLRRRALYWAGRVGR